MMNMNTAWWRLVHLDPAMLRGAVVAVVALVGALGIMVDPSLPDALLAAWVALAAIVQALWTRPAVTANSRVAVAVPDPVGSPGVVVAGEAITTASAVAIVDAARGHPSDG